MPSSFALETELTLMFMKKQTDIKNLTSNITNEFIEKQKEEFQNFKNKLEEYRFIIESKTKENIVHSKKENIEENEWFEINCKK
jgi:hypothetical protein